MLTYAGMLSYTIHFIYVNNFKKLSLIQKINLIIFYVFSLYPTILKYRQFPTGYPDCYVGGSIEPHRMSPNSSAPYFGLALVKIKPPRQLKIPVLPSNDPKTGKLVFHLCRSCMTSASQTMCTHNDEERSWIAVYTTSELYLAQSKNYEIVEIYEVLDWPPERRRVYNRETNTHGIFSEFIDRYLTLKVLSTGFPDDVVTDEDRDKFVDDYKMHEGISIEKESVKKNKGLRQVAKLMLNALWGRFSMKNGKRQTILYQAGEGEKLFQKLHNQQTRMCNVSLWDNVVMAEFQDAKDCAPECGNTNIFIGVFTTSEARILLYQTLDKLGDNLLYCDTDSAIYKWCPGDYEVELGDYLGCFTNELEGDGEFIQTFLSAGAKAYCYRTNLSNVVCKTKGIKLTHSAAKVLNFSTFNRLIVQKSDETPIVVEHRALHRNKQQYHIYSADKVKSFKMTNDKRVHNPNDYSSLPFGYCEQDDCDKVEFDYYNTPYYKCSS